MLIFIQSLFKLYSKLYSVNLKKMSSQQHVDQGLTTQPNTTSSQVDISYHAGMLI